MGEGYLLKHDEMFYNWIVVMDEQLYKSTENY